MRAHDDTALLVIDLQRQFTDPAGAVPVDGADVLLDRTNHVAAGARAAGVPVVWVEQRLRARTGPGRSSTRFGTNELHRGWGADLDPVLQIEDDDVRLVKRRQSAFYGTDLDLVLRQLQVRRVLLAGVTTNVCVLATAKDAAERDLTVVTLGDLTASRPIERGDHHLTATEVQRTALAFIEYAYGEVQSSAALPWAGQEHL